MAIQLRPYQLEAVQLALKHLGFCLFLEQRTGKTPTAIEIVRHRQPTRLLVICPKVAVGEVWEKALGEAGLNCDIRIVTFGEAWRSRAKLKRWVRDHFVILDEAHSVSNPDSRQSSGIRSIGRTARWRLALDGTPIGEGLHKAWGIFDFIDGDIFGKWSAFKRKYCIKGGFRNKKIIGYRNRKQFARILHTYSYRKTLNEVQGFDTVERPRVIRFDLTESLPTYLSLENQFIAELANGQIIAIPLAVSRAMKLHQLSSGFIIDEEQNEHRVGDEKLERLGRFLLRHEDEPLVIFVRFLRDLRRISKLCAHLGIAHILVSGQNRFRGFSGGVAIVQVASGVSIDLSAADHAVFYTWDYSMVHYDQAKFRIRYFGAREVRYTYFVARGTVDEILYQSVTSKVKFSKLLLDHYRKRGLT